MKNPLLAAAVITFVAMTVAFVAWLGWPWGVALGLPLAACAPFMRSGRPRALVAGGALALPYLCFAILEIIVNRPPPAAAVAMLAAGAAYFALLAPATRLAARLARER